MVEQRIGPVVSSALQPIDNPRHPAVRRIADVMRGPAERPRTFIIDDAENIAQAVECGISLDTLYATTSAVSRERLTLADDHPSVPLHILDDAVANSMFGGQRRSRVFALAQAPHPPRLQDLSAHPSDIVALDGVRMVGNIGAITRTACALGAAGVVLLNSDLRNILDRRLIRASRGLVFATPVVISTHKEVADFVQRENISVAILSAGASESLQSVRMVAERLMIVLGSERNGVSPEFEALATHRYTIAMTERVESLNVSVAAAIALYEHRFRQ